MHRRQLFTILLLLAIAILVLPSSAHAYLDPGTGSYIFQLLAAAIFGALFLLKVYWKRIKALLQRLVTKDKALEDDQKS